jgi:glycosyltransferase involved in cell wall biosynthesis
MKLFQNIFDKIVVISNYVKNTLVEAGIESEKIRVIYGSNIDAQICKKNYSCSVDIFKNNKKNITIISRISPEKGIDLFVKAVSLLDEEVKEKCHFHIVGNGPSTNEIRSLINKLNLDNIITMWGYQQHVFEYVESSYVTVSTTHTEGLGLTILEAMAMSKICIAPKVGGIPEIIENDKNGLLYNEGDFIMLAKLITYCVNNTEKVDLLGKRAARTIEEKFDLNKIIIQLKKVIEE